MGQIFQPQHFPADLAALPERFRAHVVADHEAGEVEAHHVLVGAAAELHEIAARQQQTQKVIAARTDLEAASIQYQSAQAAASAKLLLAEADRKVIAAKNESELDVLKRNVDAYGSGEAYIRSLLYGKIAPQIQSIMTRGEPGGIFGLPLPPPAFNKTAEGGK